MAKSSLFGIDPPNPGAPGHDEAALGPSDSSDSGSDMAGTGERRSAADDAGGREARDISVDRVFRPIPAEGGAVDVDDPDGPLPDDVAASAGQTPQEDDADDEDDDGDEDESADPVGDGHADADLAARLPARPHRPLPEPDPSDDGTPGPANGDMPGPDDDSRHHRPGRDAGLRRTRI